MRAREYFRDMGRNFMTPYNVQYRTVGRFAVELSEGEGFDRTPIYGVSVVDRATGEMDFELSYCFHSEAAVQWWLNELRGK